MKEPRLASQLTIRMIFSGSGQDMVTSGQFVWHGKNKGGFTTDLMKNTLLAMDDNANNHANKRFRKIVICIETCYSGSVFAFDAMLTSTEFLYSRPQVLMRLHWQMFTAWI